MLNREYLYFNCDCNIMIDRLLCIVQISYKEMIPMKTSCLHSLSMPNTTDMPHLKPLSVNTKATLTAGRKEVADGIENIRATQICIPSETQPVSALSFADYVKSAAGSILKDDYIAERTVISFNSIRKVTSEVSFDADERNIRNWLAIMLRKGTSPVTLRRYLGKLHKLYSDFRGVTIQGEALFSSLRETISDQSLYGSRQDSETLNKIKDLPSRLQSMPTAQASIAKAMMYIFYLGGAPYSVVSDLRFNDDIPEIDQLREIVESMPRERRTYVFPFKHGSVRQRQLHREMTAGFTTLLSDLAIRPGDAFSAETICVWWIDAAIECGLNPEEIAGVVRHIPSTHAWLRAVNPLPLSEDEKTARLRIVADMIADTTPRWYAMFMRDNNTPDDILDTIGNAGSTLMKEIQFFYPTRKILKQKNDKKVWEQVPFIPHILFFKSRPDKVKPLFNLIGDFAWCFRTVNRPQAPYAVISGKEMDCFQKVIGVLDESIKMEFVQNPDLIPDRKVRITGGEFNGYEGTIYRQKGTVDDSDMRYFILRINDSNNIVWQVKIEEIFIEPLDTDN